MFAVYRAQGNSMSPQIKSGDYVVLFTWIFFRPWPGLQVVYQHPDYGVILKSVIAVNHKKKTFSSQGLNSLSVSARNLKDTPMTNIKGFVIWHLYQH